MRRKLQICYHGGGPSCQKQGGDGSSMHAPGYIHSIPTVSEIGGPVGDAVTPVSKGQPKVVKAKGLEEFFEEDLSKSVLQLPIHDSVDHSILQKSFYDFDLYSREGIGKLLELLPVMDPDILRDIMGEIWPGFVADDVDPRLARAEIKGYLMDYMDEKGME